MNCKEWEERIALYCGGDAPAAEARQTERHLADCAGCQMFASGLKQSLALLQDMHQEALAPAHFAAVRARVIATLERERLPVWRRFWAYGLAGAVVALLLVLAVRTGQRGPETAANRKPVPGPLVSEVKPPEIAVQRAGGEPASLPHPVRHVHRTPARRAPARVQTAAAAPKDTVMVKLVTDDPNVVIYWIAERRGE